MRSNLMNTVVLTKQEKHSFISSMWTQGVDKRTYQVERLIGTDCEKEREREREREREVY